VREFPGQFLWAGRARRRISPVCHRAAPLAGRWSGCPAAQWCLVAASIASARNPSHSSRALTGPFEPVAYAEPERLPRWMPSELPRSKEALLFAWRANASALPLFPTGGEPTGVFGLPALRIRFPWWPAPLHPRRQIAPAALLESCRGLSAGGLSRRVLPPASATPRPSP
jgi:hypothetical protein